MPDGRIGIAMVSFAHSHAHDWSRAINRSQFGHVAVVWDADSGRGTSAAGQYGAEYVADLDAALAHPAVAAAAVCSENAHHAEHVVRAAAAGKHVLCEKPMATTLEDCDRMITACRDHGVHYMQAFPKRFDPACQTIKGLLDDGVIGRVGSVRLRHGHYFALRPGWVSDPGSAWIRDSDLGGGGALIDEGVHGADLLRWLFGPPRSVMAESATLLTDLDVDDNASMIWSFRSGVLATQQSNWTDVAATNTLEISGERGVIIQRHSDCASTRVTGEMTTTVSLFREEPPSGGPSGWQHLNIPVHFRAYHETVAERFLDCLRTGSEPLVTGEDGRNALAMILAAYRSAASGCRVTIDERGSGVDQLRSEAT